MTLPRIVWFSILFFMPLLSWGVDASQLAERNIFKRPFYAGVTFGYGATTWGYLISPDENSAITISTPTKVDENGEEWGIIAGFEFLPTFALELSYDRYPEAEVFFDEISLFTFEHNELTSFYTNTESVSLSGKFMIVIPRNENFRAFATTGAAIVHRKDIIADKYQLTPKFGVGGNFGINESIMVEFGIDYTAGNGVSEINPANNFIPFLYSVFTRFIIRV